MFEKGFEKWKSGWENNLWIFSLFASVYAKLFRSRLTSTINKWKKVLKLFFPNKTHTPINNSKKNLSLVAQHLLCCEDACKRWQKKVFNSDVIVSNKQPKSAINFSPSENCLFIVENDGKILISLKINIYCQLKCIHNLFSYSLSLSLTTATKKMIQFPFFCSLYSFSKKRKSLIASFHDFLIANNNNNNSRAIEQTFWQKLIYYTAAMNGSKEGKMKISHPLNLVCLRLATNVIAADIFSLLLVCSCHQPWDESIGILWLL